MQSGAKTVEEYLAELPDDRRPIIETIRNMVVKNLPKGYQEVMNWGMISYEIPLSTYPTTYNKQPLMYAAVAAQKNHNAIYLTCVYSNKERLKWLEDQFAKANKKLNMGKSCIRFKKLDDIPLDAIGQVIGMTSVKEYIDIYEKGKPPVK